MRLGGTALGLGKDVSPSCWEVLCPNLSVLAWGVTIGDAKRGPDMCVDT